MTFENQDRSNSEVIYACDWIRYSKQLKEYKHPPFIKCAQTTRRQETERILRAHTFDGWKSHYHQQFVIDVCGIVLAMEENSQKEVRN